MRAVPLLVLAALLGCGEGSDGEIRVMAFSLADARDGIAASRTADGFEVQFDSIVLAIEGFAARTTAGDDAGVPFENVLVDLAGGRAQAFAFPGVPARRWDEVSFASRPPVEGVRLVNVAQDLADEMIREGWSFFVSGTMISPAGERTSYRFGFPVEVNYRSCISGQDRTRGLVVPESGVSEVEVTWHLTHLFFDSFAEDSNLRVEPFAAAAVDGMVTVENLSAQDLTDLRGLDGGPLLDEIGNPLLFIPPPGGAATLREHLLNARFGHFNGLEGSCTTDLRILE